MVGASSYSCGSRWFEAVSDGRPRCLRKRRVASAALSWTLRLDDLVCHPCRATWHLVAAGGIVVRGGNLSTAAGVARSAIGNVYLWSGSFLVGYLVALLAWKK